MRLQRVVRRQLFTANGAHVSLVLVPLQRVRGVAGLAVEDLTTFFARERSRHVIHFVRFRMVPVVLQAGVAYTANLALVPDAFVDRFDVVQVRSFLHEAFTALFAHEFEDLGVSRFVHLQRVFAGNFFTAAAARELFAHAVHGLDVRLYLVGDFELFTANGARVHSLLVHFAVLPQVSGGAKRLFAHGTAERPENNTICHG